ncbi:hypothetical protein SEA_FORZA_183 [Gordonia phage Forza]|uniref:Uncharacterized protein n=1 Tax=Gordonia phage Forza TaxID=2571247 RepID=A0A650EYL3_9CAUD|nr:hypothetical protein PP303_gp145 [Gordonia phage Forza]QGT55144.1 hypothetical protein SEA_FORZA_183 [Gordonia phage Forza]UXE04292.1 hypothetical protein SEA_BLUENGOLD_179 [Gordonia phage BlueNGold]WBF03933.1 hypothetical protein SEA_MAREELIH_180 [Gordonia phage Mareelih]
MPRRTRKKEWHRGPRKRRFTEFPLSEQEPCPRPDKYKYVNQEDAEQFINMLYTHRAQRYGTHYLPNRSYACRCGWWHVTSHEYKPKGEHDGS